MPKPKAERGGQAAKAAHQAQVAAQKAADDERREASEWDDGKGGGKAKKDAKAEKARADAARKAENAKLLAEEESSLPVKPAKPAAAAKKAEKAPSKPTPAARPAPAANEDEVESFTASGVDSITDALDALTAKSDKASVGAKAAKEIDTHPERRKAAAFAIVTETTSQAFKERELPILKEDRPGLRLQQYNELLFKMFQKSPDNPMNQLTVSYDASKADKAEMISKRKQDTLDAFRG